MQTALGLSAPFFRYRIVIFFLALWERRGWKRVQLYVQTAFLNAQLDREMNVSNPEGFFC